MLGGCESSEDEWIEGVFWTVMSVMSGLVMALGSVYLPMLSENGLLIWRIRGEDLKLRLRMWKPW
jgi:hypothetical protein